MKVVHIVRQFHPTVGGLQNFVLLLAKQQLQNNIQVGVVTLNRSFVNNEILPETENFEGIEIKRIPFKGIKKYPLAFSVLNTIQDADIIHVHAIDFFIDFLALTRFIHKKPIILHTHGGFFHTPWGYHFKKIYFNTITRFVTRFANGIIACSDSDEELFRRIRKNKVKKIYNGVDYHKYQVKKNLQKGSLLYVGRIDEHKRVDHLIHVALELLNRGISVQLNVAGPDWKGINDELKKIYADSVHKEKIVFHGSVTEDKKIDLFSQANIFVSASEYEGFGISAIEALASGTYVVLNNIPSFRTFINDPSYGMITDFSDIQKTADIIAKKLTEVDFNTVETVARNYAFQFSWEIVERKIYDFYKSVLN